MSDISLFWYHIVISIYCVIHGIASIFIMINTYRYLKHCNSELKKLLKELKGLP